MFAKLAFRNIFRSRRRTFITLTIIMSGCVTLILAAGFMEDTVTQVRESYIRDFLGHIRIFKHGFAEQGLLHPFDYLIAEPSALIDQLQSVPHVRSVSPRIHFAGLLSTGDTSAAFRAEGLDPVRERMMQNTTRLVSGEFLNKNSKFEVLVGKGLAKALQLKLGSSIVLLANTQRGAINAVDAAVKGIFGTSNKGFDDHAIRAPLWLAQYVLRTQSVESLVLFLDHTSNVPHVKADIERAFRDHHLEYDVKAWYELEEADHPAKIVAVYRGIYRVLKILILIVVTLGIVNTMNMAVLERIGEIGTLMAMGTKRSGVALLFFYEGFFTGVLGGTLGCLAGLFLAYVISLIGIHMPTPAGTTIEWTARIAVTPGAVGFAFGMAMTTAMLSSVFPAMKASRLEIAHALRHNV
jgi:putative ABC transport system permease protein